MTLTYTDMFCGAGGSSIGFTEAGLELSVALNHWQRAIETHQSNFTEAEHLCEDVNRYDLRRLPHTDVLWASPICTEMSPAGGNKRTAKRNLDQLELGSDGDPMPTAAYERTRATFHDVIRATEVHRYKAVIVENVVDVVWKWELFDWWVSGMLQLGYRVQFVSVSSAHVGDKTNQHAPQWRDRFYMVFTQEKIPLPDVQPRPIAWCPVCDENVQAIQSWRGTARSKTSRYGPVGKYGQQYDYRCPSGSCGHAIVEPYVLPAAAAIDWSDLGIRIGDRPKPLAAATLRRIRAGREMFGQPVVVANHGQTWERPGSDYVRAWPVGRSPLAARTGTPGDALASPAFTVPSGGTWREGPSPIDEPMPARTTRATDGVVVPPFMVERRDYQGNDGIRCRPVDGPMATVTAAGRTVHTLVTPPGAEPFVAMLRNNQTADSVDNPLSTVTSGGRHHGLTVPAGAFYVKNYSSRGDSSEMSKDVLAEPLGSITTKDHHSLVIPFRRGAKPHRPGDRPLSTVATKNGHALATVTDDDVLDCLFRMLKPREHLAAQRFWASYIVTGNQEEQTAQAGNAVSSNVAHWLGRAVARAIDSGGQAA